MILVLAETGVIKYKYFCRVLKPSLKYGDYKHPEIQFWRTDLYGGNVARKQATVSSFNPK